MMSAGMAAQLTLTIGRSARALARWIARATSSFPDPLSPRTSTQPEARETRVIFDLSASIGVLSPISPSYPGELCTNREKFVLRLVNSSARLSASAI